MFESDHFGILFSQLFVNFYKILSLSVVIINILFFWAVFNPTISAGPDEFYQYKFDTKYSNNSVMAINLRKFLAEEIEKIMLSRT